MIAVAWVLLWLASMVFTSVALGVLWVYVVRIYRALVEHREWDAWDNALQMLAGLLASLLGSAALLATGVAAGMWP